jgi:hypothetical protein
MSLISIVSPDWSNFEIADMDFWRGPAYTAFFEHLDFTGGFYYEVRESGLQSSAMQLTWK